MRLVSFDYFRGIAILIIVAGHSFGQWTIDTTAEKIFANLISGGTTLFVFISGFFFHYVFYDKFNYRKFMVKKSFNVLLPYVIFSTVALLLFIFSATPLPAGDALSIANPDSFMEIMRAQIIYLWTGRIASPYWYIPFIIIIFALSPIFLFYIRLPSAVRLSLFFVLLILSLFVHRPHLNLSPLHSVVYFTPVYLLGILCSLHREEVMHAIKGRSLLLGSFVVLLAVVQAFIYDSYGNRIKEEIFSYEGIDIVIIQKIFLCFFILSVLQNLERKNLPILKLLAASSFAIYFLHHWILFLIDHTQIKEFMNVLPGLSVFFVRTLVVVVCSLGIAYIAKLTLKQWSRNIIGW